jgi:hypothetical protein
MLNKVSTLSLLNRTPRRESASAMPSEGWQLPGPATSCQVPSSIRLVQDPLFLIRRLDNFLLLGIFANNALLRELSIPGGSLATVPLVRTEGDLKMNLPAQSLGANRRGSAVPVLSAQVHPSGWRSCIAATAVAAAVCAGPQGATPVCWAASANAAAQCADPVGDLIGSIVDWVGGLF